MYVAELNLTDFRSYREVKVGFAPGINVLIGTNGQGKTNLVEAIHYLATFGSHRVAQDQPLVRTGTEYAIVEAAINEGIAAGEHAREMRLQLQIVPGKSNAAKLNGSPSRHPRELLGLVQTVVFAPEDLNMVKGNPGDRRKFLDDTLSQLNPSFASLRQDLDRILKQRNALLKNGQFHQDVDALRTLEVWDEQLSRVGGQVMFDRIQLVNQLREPVNQAYMRVSSDRGPLEISYQTDTQVDSNATVELCQAALASALANSRKQELDRGITLVGPQRDELEIQLRGLPLRGYASHGESWSAALALKLAVFELMRAKSRHGDPVLILDDVFAELDEVRRNRLVAEVADCEQVIVTAAVRADVPENLNGALFDVFEGTVNRVA